MDERITPQEFDELWRKRGHGKTDAIADHRTGEVKLYIATTLPGHGDKIFTFGIKYFPKEARIVAQRLIAAADEIEATHG